MKAIKIKELSASEQIFYYGGNVPMAYYTCDETVDVNGSMTIGFWKGFWNSLGLW